MHDPFLMSCRQAVGDLDSDLDSAGQRKTLLRQHIAQLLPLDELHPDERHTVHVIDLVNDRDVGMFESGRRLRFLDEPALASFVGYQLRTQDLEGNVAVQLDVSSPIDDPHATSANLFEDLVPRKGLSDHGQAPKLARKYSAAN